MNQTSEKLQMSHEDLEIPQTGYDSFDVSASIYSILGAMGGVGVTTTAIQLAYYLANAKKPSNQKTILLSLDFENCAISQYLDLKPTVTLEEFKQDASIIDEAFVARVVNETAFGFYAMALPNNLGGNDRVKSETVLAFLDIISQKFSNVVLDIPRIWMPWTHAAIGAADKVAMLTELTVPGLHFANQKRQALLKAVEELANIDVVLNKTEKRAFRNSLKLSDAERSLGVSDLQAFPANADIIREAINRGMPVGAAAKDARYVRVANEVFSSWVANISARLEREANAF